MYQYMQFLTKKWRQQGAIIAFTALLLPMLIVGTGLAVDLGHVYVHYSRLQNAADAAALAGAHEYAVQGEKENNHPKADKMAEQYVQGEYHNLDRSESIVEKKYQAKTKDNITYYLDEKYSSRPQFENDDIIISIFTNYGRVQDKIRQLRS